MNSCVSCLSRSCWTTWAKNAFKKKKMFNLFQAAEMMKEC